MRLNLTEYLESEGKEETICIHYEKEMLDLLPEKRRLASPFEMKLRLINQGKGSILIEGEETLKCFLPCDRCLQDCSVSIPITISDEITQEQILTSASESGESRSYLEGYLLDTDRLIEDAAASEFPVKILCKEDCKGICPVCGCDRNEKECDCDTFIPHPGMAAITEIFAKSRADAGFDK